MEGNNPHGGHRRVREGDGAHVRVSRGGGRGQTIVLGKSNVWLTLHRNSVWIRNQLHVTFVLSFISPLQVAQHVSGNYVPIFRS